MLCSSVVQSLCFCFGSKKLNINGKLFRFFNGAWLGKLHCNVM
ncbi:hypothetical protein RNAN_1229 [Rheinheimera nanhaiensis E407-8]|uniref:Uncharacterized protein n=1 Tax=Rheinheimera nanhaiensis E407-8 TaxID=562729 RepID=I1DW30_9GAMM|nr:hypothetical protein RNAN_1229 [Rheinheimera nanhaiensis E407-8]